MHCPKVLARTATPVGMIPTWVTPGIFSTSALFLIESGVPLSSGARQTIVGSASGTSRSIANFFLPVTASRASTRRCGLPTTACSEVSFSSTSTFSVVGFAALAAASPYVTEDPPGALITPPLATSCATVVPSRIAAASSSALRAIAAATRTGVYTEMIVLEPPVSWLKSSSGRAGASVTCTWSTGSSSSSAISMDTAVVMPWPTSIRGSAKWAWPFSSTSIAIRFEVGIAQWVRKSLRS